MSLRRISTLAVVVVVLLLLISPAGAQSYLPLLKGHAVHPAAEHAPTATLTLPAVADATIRSWDANTNFGFDFLLVGYSHIDTDEVASLLIQFDLAGLPPEAVIDSAILDLYQENDDPAASTVQINARPFESAWAENTVTWNNRPDLLPTAYPAIPLTSAAGWKEFDITGMVSLWHEGTPNHGLLLFGPSLGDAFYRRFTSRHSDHNAPVLTVTYHLPPPCYTLTRAHSGEGSNPVADPPNSAGCAAGKYVAGEVISVSATPNPGWTVTGWSGTGNNASTSTTNSLTMPAANHTVSVTFEPLPPTCYPLTRTHTGQGTNPVATPTSSPGCPAGSYTAGAAISLSASPATGWQVMSWSGTDNNSSTSTSNNLTMPAGAHTVSVIYGELPPVCHTLTRIHTGSGADPLPTPASSPGCSYSHYTADEEISLSADPDEGWQVAGWNGTDDDASTDLRNSVTMPDADHTMQVIYSESPSPAPPDRSWSFAGHVFVGSAGDGSPATGVRVSLYGSDDASGPGEKLGSSLTTADGGYLLGLGIAGDLEYDHYWVGLDDPNYAVADVEPGPDGEVLSGRVRYDPAAADSFFNTVFYVASVTQTPTLMLSELVPLWNLPVKPPDTMPAIDPPGPPMDLKILGVEVTQGVQCFDKSSGFTNCANNSVKLVEGKPIAVRVYIGHTGGPTCPAGSASQTYLSGVRVGLNFWSIYVPPPKPGAPPPGVSLWSGPGTPQWFDVPCGQKIDDLANPANSLRNHKWGSATYIIPANQIPVKQGGYYRFIVRATVNQDGPKYKETNYKNNSTGYLTFTVGKVKSMNVRWALIDYKPQKSTLFPAYTGTNLANAAAAGGAGALMQTMYPRIVTYTQAPTIAYTGLDAREDAGQDKLLFDILPKAMKTLQPQPHSLFGWLPEGALDGAFAGIATVGPFPGSGGTGYGDQTSWHMPEILAHEIGHNRYLVHPKGNPGEQDDPCWPYPNDVRMRESAFNVSQLTPYYATENEVMNGVVGAFFSPYSYNRLLGIKYSTTWSKCATGTPPGAAAVASDAADSDGAFAAAAEPAGMTAAPRPVLLVSGLIHADGTGNLDPLFRMESSAPVSPNQPEAETCVELRTGGGALFARRCFTPLAANPAPADASRGFGLILPYAASVTQVVLRQGDMILAQRSASAHAPVVTVTTPGVQIASGDVANLSWEANDADGDPLHFMVLYSPDGTEWSPIGVDLTATQLSVDSSRWGAGSQARVRVLASDGFRTGAGDSDVFTVSNKKPHVIITGPGNGARQHPYAALVLTGFADDPEDGLLPDARLTWSADGRTLGQGPQLVLPGLALAPGQHTIRLTATDTEGQSNSATVMLDLTFPTFLPVLEKH